MPKKSFLSNLVHLYFLKTLKNAKRRMQSFMSSKTPCTSMCCGEIYVESLPCEPEEENITSQEASQDALVSLTPVEKESDTVTELYESVRGFY